MFRACLKQKEAELSAGENYGLSDDAAALFQWISDLRPDQYLGNLTPIVEECLERDIGLKPSWPEKNIAAYFEMLVEEINEKTDFDLRVQPRQRYRGKISNSSPEEIQRFGQGRTRNSSTSGRCGTRHWTPRR